MRTDLTALQARVIGCLVEKEITTPDQYPLSLNGLTTACNQKSNREPVLSLSEAEVQNVLDELIAIHLVVEEQAGSRVSKFKHRFCNTQFGALKLTEQELGILCVLFLRGPQTPGELRTRTNRLCHFDDVKETESVLQSMADREDGPFVVQLEREPGKRESRWAHLFVSDDESQELQEQKAQPSALGDDRVGVLELEVAELKVQVADLKKQLDELLS